MRIVTPLQGHYPRVNRRFHLLSPAWEEWKEADEYLEIRWCYDHHNGWLGYRPALDDARAIEWDFGVLPPNIWFQKNLSWEFNPDRGDTPVGYNIDLSFVKPTKEEARAAIQTQLNEFEAKLIKAGAKQVILGPQAGPMDKTGCQTEDGWLHWFNGYMLGAA